MTPEDIVRRYYDAFNKRDLDAYAKLFTEDCLVEAPGISAKGLEAMRAFDRGWMDAFPEGRIESMRMTSVGNAVATGNWFHSGPQRGPLVSPAGTIPAKGKALSAPYCTHFEIEGDRIKVQRLHYEPTIVPRMLGAM